MSIELPELDENIKKSVDELDRHLKARIADIVAVRYMVANNILCGINERERQLLEALSQIVAKDEWIATLEATLLRCKEQFIDIKKF